MMMSGVGAAALALDDSAQDAFSGAEAKASASSATRTVGRD
jgi:hypothetical protein